MPSLEDSLIQPDMDKLELSTQGSADSTVNVSSISNFDPGLGMFTFSSVPLINVNTDALRQFYRTGIPQFRTFSTIG